MLDQTVIDDADIALETGDVVFQRTLKSEINFADVGLHTGVVVNMTIKPADADHGIVFVRTDVDGDGTVPARWDRVIDTRMCSVLGNDDGISVGTVEHLMAALAGCGIDNARIELDNCEVPIMDGSSEPFVQQIVETGVIEQDTPRRVIRVLKEISVDTGAGKATLSPAEKQVIDVEIDYDDAVIRQQTVSLSVVNGAFCKELSKARTFGFLHEVEALRAAGLARGGSLDNAIVVGADGILNEDGLRFDDEFVRHKALDAVGDLYLAGAPVIGRFSGVCSGHAVNNQVLRALFADPSAWTWDVVRGDAKQFAVDGGIVASTMAAEA